MQDQETIDKFAPLCSAFAERVAELKRIALLRMSDSAKDLYATETAALDVNVRALESKLRDIQAFISSEKEAIPKVRALIAAAEQQAKQLDYIKAHLPQYLPSSRPAAQPEAHARAVAAGPLRAEKENEPARQPLGPRATGGQAEGEMPASKAPARRKAAPRRFISQAELDGLSSYVRGRLTLDKVNAALQELAQHCEANARTVAMARSGRGLSAADRKHATALLHEVASRDGIKGHFWFLESDCRAGPVVKLDKSGRSLLSALRQMGRLQEQRLKVEGVKQVVYVLL